MVCLSIRQWPNTSPFVSPGAPNTMRRNPIHDFGTARAAASATSYTYKPNKNERRKKRLMKMFWCLQNKSNQVQTTTTTTTKMGTICSKKARCGDLAPITCLDHIVYVCLRDAGCLVTTQCKLWYKKKHQQQQQQQKHKTAYMMYVCRIRI